MSHLSLAGLMEVYFYGGKEEMEEGLNPFPIPGSKKKTSHSIGVLCREVPL